MRKAINFFGFNINQPLFFYTKAKNMKKLFLLLSFTGLLLAVKAQEQRSSIKGFHFAGGINLGLGIGEFGNTHSLGLGVELQPEYSATGMFSIYGSAGYTNFFGRDLKVSGGEDFGQGDIGIIPVLAGAKVYLAPPFFIGAKLGIGILTVNASGAGFDYQPQFGFNNEKVIVNFSYNGLSKNSVTLSSLSMSILYKF